MELPQSRPQGGKATHDFLSLYASTPTNQDPATPPQGTLVKTHDFFQPLERVGTMATEENAMEPLFPRESGAFRISYFKRDSEQERNLFTSAENHESSFKLRDESSTVRGKTRKEEGTSFFMQPLTSTKKRSFIDMITSAKNSQQEDDDDEEEEIIVKREQVSVKLETNAAVDKKSSAIRSKHSATEQRRRSKINARFLKLREIIPNSEQKRDKASFLLQVIDHIHFLQDKLYRFEGPYSHENKSLSFPTMRWNQSQIQQKLSSGPEDMIPKINGKVNERGPSLDHDTISSQRLMNTITQALQRSGVDLSQAKVSVKLNLAKRARWDSPISAAKQETKKSN